MVDVVERLLNISRGDHERGCDGRSYTCSCGYDDVNEKTAEDAHAEIQRLRAEVERLTRERAEAFERAAQAAARARECDRIRAEERERAAQIAETPPHDYGWQTKGDERRARVIASLIRQAGKDGGGDRG